MNRELIATDALANGGAASPPPVTASSIVSLTIPCAAEYVGTARLTILGVASRMGFSYDQVEDIRLAVGEACTNAIARAEASENTMPATISIRSHVEPTQLIVEIEDTVPTADGSADPDQEAGDEMNPSELGALLMEILVDEVSLHADAGGTRVRLVKYAGSAASAVG